MSAHLVPGDGSYSIVLQIEREDGSTSRLMNWTPTGARPTKVTADLHSIVAWLPDDKYMSVRPITFIGPGSTPDGILQPNKTVVGSRQGEFTQGHFPSLAKFCEAVFDMLEERWVAANRMVVRTSPGVTHVETVEDVPPRAA